MKRISNRMILLLVLIGALLLGILFFTIRYFLQADEWVVFSGSPHVYTGANLSTGCITDRDGELLLDGTESRVYASDPILRKATMHLLGDRFGYISAPMLNHYAADLVGFDPVSGLYSGLEAPITAKLTVSAQAQKAALEALAGRAGAIGVYNYKTGEILCAVTSPTYDPDNMPDVEHDTVGAYDGVYLHRFFQTSYVPGSIFKVLTAEAALDCLPDAETRVFTCEGQWELEGDVITCHGRHNQLTMAEGLAHSCNVVFGQLAVELGPQVLTAYARKAGICDPLTFDGMTTSTGSFDLTGAVNSEIAWSGIGQYTDLVNPCCYMVYMGAVANGGKAAIPYVMAQAGGYRAETTYTGQILDQDTAQKLTDMMHDNVVKMYGAEKFPPLKVCAKSGTAEVGEGVTPHATFSGFIQDETYPLAFIVIVEHGGSGSATCAPIAGQVLKACVEAMR